MSYQPLPRTVPARAIEYLKRLKVGVELSTSELAQAIEADSQSLVSTLAEAKRAGLVRGRIPSGERYTMWSLGDGVPLPAPVDVDDDTKQDAPPPKATTKAAQVVGKESREGHAEQRPPAGRPVRFALWSDGALQIERDGCDNVLLAPDQTKAMFAYLDRLREREAA